MSSYYARVLARQRAAATGDGLVADEEGGYARSYGGAVLKLKRLKIDKFRRVAPGTELRFDDGINVLLGKNGTGKTTLLKLISMCVRLDFSQITQEEFDLEFDLHGSWGTASIRIRNQRVPKADLSDEIISAAVALGHRGPDDTLEPDVEIRATMNEPLGEVRYHSTPTTARLEQIGRGKPAQTVRSLLNLNETGSITASLAFASLATLTLGLSKIEQASIIQMAAGLSATQAWRFDESLALFRAITGGEDSELEPGCSATATIRRYKGVLPVLVESGFMPSTIKDYLKEQPDTGTPPTEVVLKDDTLNFLKTFLELAHIRSAEMRLDLLGSSARSPQQSTTFGRATFFFRFGDETIIRHDSLSYGQKRLLAFLYYLDCNRDVVVADELINGLHHEWIQTCLDALGGRQAFLTSQNPLLLDYLSFDSAEKAEQCFVQCRIEEMRGREIMHWANMSPEDSVRFYRGYQAGIQHVSELLRTKGLW